VPSQITYASALPGKTGKHRNCIFLYACISALPEFNQSLLDLFSLSDSRLILTLLYDSYILSSMRSARGCWGMVQEKGSWEWCSSWTVLHTQCTNVLSSGFPLSQGNAQALDRLGGKTKHHLISYTIGSCVSRLQQLKGCTFFETRCILYYTQI